MYDLSLLYGPIYGKVGFGVEAVLTVSCGDPPMTLSVIDETAGIVTTGLGRFQAEIQTVTPAVKVRAADLASVDPEKLHGAEIAFNGKTWLVDTHAFRPSPKGEAAGEILLFLKDR